MSTESKNVEKKKLSYEELENVARQLSQQAQSMQKKLQEANLMNFFKRMDYSFAIISNKSVFPKEFVEKTVNEIMKSMEIPEQKEEDKKDGETE